MYPLEKIKVQLKTDKGFAAGRPDKDMPLDYFIAAVDGEDVEKLFLKKVSQGRIVPHAITPVRMDMSLQIHLGTPTDLWQQPQGGDKCVSRGIIDYFLQTVVTSNTKTTHW